MKKIRLGTISSGAAYFTIAALLLFGAHYILFLPYLVYAVPCYAAFHKKPAFFWRGFTLTSIALAILASLLVLFLFQPESPNDVVPAYGFGAQASSFAVFHLTAFLVAGVVLFPLALLSTLHTIKMANKSVHSPT